MQIRLFLLICYFCIIFNSEYKVREVEPLKMGLQVITKDNSKDLFAIYKSIDFERYLRELEEKLLDLRGCL